MAYTKTVWQDRQVQYPMTFTQSTAANGGTTLTPNEGTVTQAGTAFTAATMNNIENGVANVDSRMTTTEGNVSTLQNQMSTANTNISNLQGSSVNKSGDTMTGTLTVPTLAATNVTEGGTALSTKYQPKYSTGTSAPSTVPSSVGLLYIDTASKKAYVSTATTAASDWEQIDQVDWTNILNKPTTVGTFGITDVYTKTQSDAQYNPKYLTGTATPSTIPSQVGMLFIDTTNKKAYVSTGTSASTDWEQIDQVDWSNILNKPTTVAGFGITDTYTKTQSDTNYYTKAQTDAQYNPKFLTGTAAPTTTPTSVGVWFIDTTNKHAYVSTGTASSSDWEMLDQITWSNVLSKPTTLAGYAISDVYDKTTSDGRFAPISGSANYENKGVAYDKATSDGKYVKNTGDTINGNLNVSTFGFTGGGSVKFDAYGNVTAVGTTSSTWNVTDSASNSAFNVKMDGSKRVATANNVLDDGSGGATVAGVFKAPSVRNSASDLGTHYDAGEMGWYDWNQSRHALRYVRSTNTVSTDGSINATGGITNGADYFQIVCYPGKGATNLIAKLWYDGTAGNLNFYNQLNGTIGLYAKAFTTSSNRELKTNIVKDEENALEKVKATTVYNYQFKQDLEDWGEDADGNLVLLGQKDPSTVPVQTGIIVDEAPKDIIGENGESINLYAMTTLLWKAVQELSAKNDSLEQRILALEGK
jgi:hypothetical protein